MTDLWRDGTAETFWRERTLYRPDCEDETSALIEQTLNILVDMRVRDEVLGAVRALPDHLTPELSWSRREATDEGDTNTLKGTLRLLLPSGGGIGERWFRAQHGWSGEEIARIISLLRLVAATLRAQAAHVVLDGTAETMLRDAERVENFAMGWL